MTQTGTHYLQAFLATLGARVPAPYRFSLADDVTWTSITPALIAAGLIRQAKLAQRHRICPGCDTLRAVRKTDAGYVMTCIACAQHITFAEEDIYPYETSLSHLVDFLVGQLELRPTPTSQIGRHLYHVGKLGSENGNTVLALYAGEAEDLSDTLKKLSDARSGHTFLILTFSPIHPPAPKGIRCCSLDDIISIQADTIRASKDAILTHARTIYSGLKGTANRKRNEDNFRQHAAEIFAENPKTTNDELTQLGKEKYELSAQAARKIAQALRPEQSRRLPRKPVTRPMT